MTWYVPRQDGDTEDQLAVQQVVLCPESRQLAVAGASYVIHFRFSRNEKNAEVPVSNASRCGGHRYRRG